MNRKELEDYLRGGETLSCEFKSDLNRGYNDKEISEVIVALANTDGGVLFLGVEDSGEVTGVSKRQDIFQNIPKFRSKISSLTSLNLSISVYPVEWQGYSIITIKVDKSREICATSGGKVLRRVIGSDGKPATVPFYPHEQISREITFKSIDYSSQIIPGTDFRCLDPVEISRLRSILEKRPSEDSNLVKLSDEELCKALRLVETQGDTLIPNVSGLLMLGRSKEIESYLPNHGVNLQVIDKNLDVRLNETFRSPLLKVLEEIESRFIGRIEENEVTIGLFRYPIPDYSRDGLREAVNNAMLHRDYSRHGEVYIQWQPDQILITNPGGFPEGITLDNILVHEPSPRNERLADVFKRVGLIEKSGRGVDKIYYGQVLYGRQPPDYSRSDRSAVRIVISGGETSLAFATFVFEENKKDPMLSLDELLVMNALYAERRIDSLSAGKITQKGTHEGRKILELLHERGLVEGHGNTRSREYIISPSLYQRLNMESEYIRAKGFESIQQEQMILGYVREHERIDRSMVAELCRIESRQAGYILRKMVKKHPEFVMIGVKRGAYYVWKP